MNGSINGSSRSNIAPATSERTMTLRLSKGRSAAMSAGNKGDDATGDHPDEHAPYRGRIHAALSSCARGGPKNSASAFPSGDDGAEPYSHSDITRCQFTVARS